MKIKTIFLGFLAVAMAITGCSKTERQGESDQVGSFRLKLTELEETRAPGPSVGATVNFKDGWLLFVNHTEHITKRVKIITTGTADNDNTVAYTELRGAGSVIENVPQSSVKVYFFGNTPDGVTIPPVNTDIETLVNSMIDVATQSDPTEWGVKKVSLFGVGEVKKVVGLAHQAEAEFDVYPIVSRMEITKFSVDKTGASTTSGNPSVIEEFQVDGIFINNFYKQAKVTGDVVGSDLVLYTSVSNYPGEIYYSTPYTGVLYDYSTGGVGSFTDPDYKPNTGSAVWGYNIFSAETPNIVVKLSNIDTGSSGVDLSGIYYLTIRNYRDANGSVTHFQKGKVYTLADIPVHEDNLTTEPEEEGNIDVLVKANIIPWEKIPLTPEFP